MKLITPLWSDPVGWSEKVAKTKLRVFIWALIHIAFVLFGLCSIYWLLQKAFGIPGELGDSRPLILLAIAGGAAPIVFIGIGYPVMYLYAMHRLLVMLRAQKQSPSEGAKDREHAA